MSAHAAEERFLVTRAQDGDRAACGELIRRHQDLIFNAVSTMVADTADAEDLTQTVLLKALENIQSFEGRSKFSTWLYSIMVNTVRGFRREKARRGSLSLESGTEDGYQPLKMGLETTFKEPWEALVSQENVDRIRAGIQSLRHDYRDIIVLRDMEGLSYKTLAEVLDITPGTVKSRLSRAREALKKQLE